MNLFEALGTSAMVAYKMYVVIVVVAFFAFAMAKGITHHAIKRGNAMNNAFFGEYLQGSVNSYPIKGWNAFFNIAMPYCTIGIAQEKMQNSTPAIRNT